ncbi:MAG: hypothetical protein NZ473_00160 [Candidatus Kapabacteria bacterium]|nr:hypothetical protein [Candidatus Kapabacteria bacterium]MCS7169531.1 hypothetical protein [Candidatus Kapabacteria bacterium]MDW7997644.1 hypothetical protein [Bacteroidota bacterium]MDW8224625.1 hypothetical protein [Bacteroidota bacterium]
MPKIIVCVVGLSTVWAGATTLQLRTGTTAVRVAAGWEVHAPAVVLNTGTDALRVIVEMDTSAMPYGTLPYFCWGPSCYAPGVLRSPDTVTIAPGAEEHSFKAYVYTEPGTPEGPAILRFRFRDALTDAVLLEYSIRVFIAPLVSEQQLLAWAHTELRAPPGAEVAGGAALYNPSSTTRRLRVRIEPNGLPASAVRFCLGDTCYPEGVLEAPDTLVLQPRHLYARFQCWIQTASGSSGSLRVRITEATTNHPVAEYSLSLSPLVHVNEPHAIPLCTLMPTALQSSPIVHLPQGTVLEITNLLGEWVLRVPFEQHTAATVALQRLPVGVYAYRLRRGTTTVCTGLFLQAN